MRRLSQASAESGTDKCKLFKKRSACVRGTRGKEERSFTPTMAPLSMRDAKGSGQTTRGVAGGVEGGCRRFSPPAAHDAGRGRTTTTTGNVARG